MAWNKNVPNVLVSKASYPNAPDASLGKALPWLIGDHRSLALRVPFPTAYGDDKRRHEHVGGANLWTPGVVVDRGGLGPSSLKILFAGHKCENSFAPADGNGGLRQYILNVPHGSAIASNATTKVNTNTEAGVTVLDDTAIAYCPAIPVDVHMNATGGGDANTALNPRNAFDLNESSYAYLDQDQGANILDLYLPNLSPLGAWFSTTWAIGYRTYTAGGGNDAGFSIGLYDITSNTYATNVTLAASTTATSNHGSFPAGTIGAWDLSTTGGGGTGFSLGDAVCLRVCFKNNAGATLGAHQKVRVYFIGCYINYRPNQDLLVAERIVTINPHIIGHWDRPWLLESLSQPPDEFRSMFATNIIGKQDDNTDGYTAGDMTGTANATIERTGDAIKWLLCRGGGFDPTNDFENGASSFGSFVLARHAVQPVQGFDFVHSLAMTEQRRVSDWVRLLAQDALASVWLDPFDNKWRIKHWVDSETVDYDHTFHADDLAIFEVDETSDTEIENALRVKYGYESATKTYLFDTFINPLGSDDGAPSGGPASQSLTISSITVASCVVTNTLGTVTGTGFTTGATALQPGMGVFGTGVPANTAIISVDSNTQFTMSKHATSTPGAQTLTFTTNGTIIYGNSPNPYGRASDFAYPSWNAWYWACPAAGTYTDPAALAKAYRDAFYAEYDGGSGSSYTWGMGWSFKITAENDTIPWKLTTNTGGVDYTSTIAHADYASGTALATAAQTALNATIAGVSGLDASWAVSYDVVTGKFSCVFTFNAYPGHTFTSVTISLATTYGVSAWKALGYQRGSARTGVSSPATFAGDYVRGDQLFYIDFSGGAGKVGFGSTPMNAHGLIGALDAADASVGNWTAGAKRGTHVQDTIDSSGTYGEKGEVPYYAESIRDWRSAVDYRDRRLKFRQATRKLVRIASRMCPDLQRGRIIQFDADCDRLQKYAKYASDGTWAGKKFRVLNVTQALQGEMWTEAIAVEVN